MHTCRAIVPEKTPNGTTNFLGLLKVERGELDFSSTASGSTYANMTVGNSSTTTTLKLNNATINVGTLHITGNTILDFGTSGASILSATNIYIDSGYTLTVQNWDSEVDFLYALTDFRLNSSGGTLAAYNAIGPVPEDLVLFPGTNSANGSNTTWTNNSYYAVVNASGNYVGAQNKEIRPVPEPSTYGAIFLGLTGAFLGWRRWRRDISARVA